jgi:hypothetical protein
MTEDYISLVCQSKSRNTCQWIIFHLQLFRDFLWQTSDIYSPVMCFGNYVKRPVIYTLPSCVSGFTFSRHVLSKSRNTWRGNIYHRSFKVNLETHDGRVYITCISKEIPEHMTGEYISLQVIYTLPSCVSRFTLKDQWYILPRHVLRDFLWNTSDIYSPVMCFEIYFERPVIVNLETHDGRAYAIGLSK